MKYTFLITLFTALCIAQEKSNVSLYGNLGLGISKVQYTDHRGGTTARLGLTLSVFNVLLKYDRTVNNEIEFILPQEKITGNSYWIGYALQPFKTKPQLVISGKIGKGKVVSIRREKDNAQVFSFIFLDEEHTLNIERSDASLYEIDVEMRFGQNVGLYWGIFSQSNRIRNVIGGTFGVLIGIF